MYYNNLLNVVDSLLNCSELTICSDNACWMNYFKMNEYSVDSKIFDILRIENIIRLDSGNLEYDEENYVLDLDDYSISKIDRIYIN